MLRIVFDSFAGLGLVAYRRHILRRGAPSIRGDRAGGSSRSGRPSWPPSPTSRVRRRLRELHPDRDPVLRLAGGPALVPSSYAITAFCHPSKIQAGQRCGSSSSCPRPLQQDRLQAGSACWASSFSSGVQVWLLAVIVGIGSPSQRIHRRIRQVNPRINDACRRLGALALTRTFRYLRPRASPLALSRRAAAWRRRRGRSRHCGRRGCGRRCRRDPRLALGPVGAALPVVPARYRSGPRSGPISLGVGHSPASTAVGASPS